MLRGVAGSSLTTLWFFKRMKIGSVGALRCSSTFRTEDFLLNHGSARVQKKHKFTCMYVCIYMYVCLHGCMYACMYVCLFLSMLMVYMETSPCFNESWKRELHANQTNALQVNMKMLTHYKVYILTIAITNWRLWRYTLKHMLYSSQYCHSAYNHKLFEHPFGTWFPLPPNK